MKIVNSKLFYNFNRFTFLVVLLLSQTILSAQTTPAPIQSDSVQSHYSNFSIGISMGFSGLFAGSSISKSNFDNDYVNGLGYGLLLEYNFDQTSIAIQFTSEFNVFVEMLDKRYIKNREYYYLNNLGFKYQPDFTGDFYLLSSLGVLYFNRLQFQGGLSVGYELTSTKNKRFSRFLQLGYAIAGGNDGIFMFKFGLKYNL